jgi:hypothetical protein
MAVTLPELKVKKPGKFSRSKGMRSEYIVRNHLRTLGYTAERVPLSGASAAMKGDVIAYKNNSPVFFEVKCREDAFVSVFRLYRRMADKYDKTLRFMLNGVLVWMSTEFTEKNVEGVFLKDLFLDPKDLKTAKSILRMREWLKGADYLVIRMDRSPLLFLRFW